jgi:DNA-binding response OmpR family regulator
VTALVVDDDPDIADIVSVALGPYGIEVESVHDGVQAISRLKSQTYDLLVLDLGITGLDGFGVLQHIRDVPALNALPVLVLTADGSDEAIARSFGYGADDFVVKPVKLHELGMRSYRLLYPYKRC